MSVEPFIESTFRSVWSLELLLMLRRSPGECLDRGQLVAALRASEAVISIGIESLIAAGLVVENDAGQVRYAPASAELDQKVGATEQLYKVRPDAVRRLIVHGHARGLDAFANAFKLRGD